MTKASMPELLKYCQVVGLEFKDSLYSKPHCEEFGIDVSHLEIITMETIERGIHIICEVNFITENQINP
jgi:predicted methyltransferase MtxX (methanogen marker protein 4)